MVSLYYSFTGRAEPYKEVTVESLGDRLQQAVEVSRFPSLRKFAEAFSAEAREKGVKGHSLPTLYRHFRGEGKPPSDRWLELYSDVAGVRLEWLREGGGEFPTEAEHIRFTLTALPDDLAATEWIGEGSTSFAALRELTLALIDGCSDVAKQWEVDEVVRYLGDLIRIPLGRLDLQEPAPHIVYGYVTSTAMWLLALVRNEEPHGHTVTELLRLLSDDASRAWEE